jgi:hypothetical protein
VLFIHYCAGDKTEKNEIGRTCSSDGEGRGVYSVVVGKPEGKGPLGRLRCRGVAGIAATELPPRVHLGLELAGPLCAAI